MQIRLAHIFSACLALGIFPDNMKCALMIFIPKPGNDKCDPTNYRPISLLSVLGKIFEKILTNRLTLFMADKNLHHPHQYGFRRGRGTVSALAMSYEWISRQKAVKGAQVTMVARDIKGAFNFLPHRRIKYHLLAIGLPPMLLKALSSFLHNRSAKIKVGSIIGPPFPLNSGAPQGAGPSVALFNLCVRNSPPPDCPRQYWAQYADDTHQLIMTVQPSAKANRHDLEVQRAISVLNAFEAQEGLITETAKSWIMPIEGTQPPLVSVDGHEYQFPTNGKARLLGLNFS